MKTEEALELIKQGFAVVPVHVPLYRNGKVVCTCKRGPDCTSIGKHPIPVAWIAASSTKPDDIKAWWKHYRGPNIGVVTGARSGVVVVDIDPRHGGNDTLDNLQVKNGRLPDTAMVITGSGGAHYYFKHPGVHVGNGKAGVFGAGVDFRGDGGFVVGPGSKHSCGGIYGWEASSTPEEVGFAEMPKWMLEIVFRPATKASEPNQLSDGNVSEGGRNVWLTSLAGAMRRKGCGYRPIIAALLAANEDCCNPPLMAEEVDRIAKSIIRYPVGGQ